MPRPLVVSILPHADQKPIAKMQESIMNFVQINEYPVNFLPPPNISEEVLEEKFGKQSMFHPMCCITARFIEEGYSLDDLVSLYKELV